MDGKDWLSSWDAVVAKGNNNAIEEAFLLRLEEDCGDGTELVEGLRRLRHGGKKTLAVTLMELAADQAEAEGAWQARKVLLSEMLRLRIGREEAWRAGLEVCVRHLWADRPSLEPLLERFSLNTIRQPLKALSSLEAWLMHDVGGVFAMAGRGAGRVVEANPELGVLRLDFAAHKRVPVPIDAAGKFLTPLEQGHFLRRRLEEPHALSQEIADDPASALEGLLLSFSKPLSVSEIKAALDGVLAEERWTSWWNRARKHPRVLASGSGSRVRYRLAAGEGAEHEVRQEFEAASVAQRVDLARRHGTRSRELGQWMADELLGSATDESADAGARWEAVQVAARLGAAAAAVRGARAGLLASHAAVEILETLNDALQREQLLDVLRERDSEAWIETAAEWLAQETHPRLLGRLMLGLGELGEDNRASAFLDRVFLHPQRSPAAFVWVCEQPVEGELAGLLEDRRGGPLLLRLVELAERKEFGPFRARLKEVLSPRGVAAVIVQQRLTPDLAKRLLQIVAKPGEMGEERSWLHRATLARFPELREDRRDEGLPALAETVVRLQDELRALLEKEIPAVLKAIQVAREHGDLSENFEYHAARARQELLSARASQLQDDLARVRVVDPASVDTSRVRVGVRVRLTRDGEERLITILGPHEAEPKAGVVSFESPAGRALLERAVGDEAVVEGKSWRVEAIERLT